MARKQLSIHSYNKEDTTYAQQILNQYGGYDLAVDGIYGEKTQQAVKEFQQANGLTADGILGKNTWAALTAFVESQQTPNKTADSGYDPEKDENYQAILRQIADQQALLQGEENPLSDYEKRLDQLAREMAQREFSYDMSEDPLFLQYQAQFTRQGELAMLDAMGAAAGLTGGYGSSYAQGAGQQAYQAYAQKLSDIMPELYGLALEQFEGETKDLQSRYDDLLNEAKLAQTDYNQRIKNHQSVLDDLYARLQQTYKNSYTEKKDLYNAIVKLISQTGYIPPADQLKKAGMTAQEAKAYQRAYYS